MYRKALKRGEHYDLQAQSDRKYIEIMGAAHPDTVRLMAAHDPAQIPAQIVADLARDSAATVGRAT
jgi:hypothetical protein